MSYSDTKTQPRPIAEIVREKTNDGELIVDFLVDMVLGKVEGANHWHRLEATRQLQRLGLEIPNAVKQAVSPPANGYKPVHASGESQPKDELAEIIREETDGGRDIVRFLIDAMQGKLEGFKPRHRLAASDRLITRGFDNAPGHTVVPDKIDDRYNAEDAPFDFENYTIDDYARDRSGTRALFHIFGGEEAKKAASNAYSAYRWHTETELDRDHSPIENPEDDPFGKGCYGYNVLAINYGDNEGIRTANKAALEFNREKYKHLLNEDDSLSALADTSSLDPKTLQYLERNRHLLAEKEDPPALAPPPSSVTPEPPPVILSEAEGPPVSEHPQEPPVGEGLRPSRDPEGSPASAPPSSSASPDHPPAEHNSERPHDTPVGEGFKPSREYGHCRDCSVTVDPPHVTPEPPPVTPEPPPVILSEAEGSPAPTPPPTSSTIPPNDDPLTPEPPRRSGRRTKRRLRRRLLAASRSGPIPGPGPVPVITNSDRAPPTP